MNREQIIEMAEKANWGLNGDYSIRGIDNLERFAAIVADAAREECARICEDGDYFGVGKHKAVRIRARGETKLTSFFKQLKITGWSCVFCLSGFSGSLKP